MALSVVDTSCYVEALSGQEGLMRGEARPARVNCWLFSGRWLLSDV